jgi:hypothetical protein
MASCYFVIFWTHTEHLRDSDIAKCVTCSFPNRYTQGGENEYLDISKECFNSSWIPYTEKIGTQEVKNDCFTTQKSLKENSVEIYEIKAYFYILGTKIFWAMTDLKKRSWQDKF